MKHPKVALWTLAAVHLVLFIVLPFWWQRRGSMVSTIAIPCWAVVLSQGSLLGLWAALGGKPTPWRATFVVIVAASWLSFCGWRGNDLVKGSYTNSLIGQSFQVMGILLLARFMGLRLSKTEGGDEDHLAHLQFSVGQALSWMTALVVFMAASHYLKDAFAAYFDYRFISYFLSWLVVALAAIWLICGSRWIAFRCAMLLLVIGLGTAWIVQTTNSPWWGTVNLLGCEAVVAAPSLAVVRLAGYRLVWYWPFRRSTP